MWITLRFRPHDPVPLDNVPMLLHRKGMGTFDIGSSAIARGAGDGVGFAGGVKGSRGDCADGSIRLLRLDRVRAGGHRMDGRMDRRTERGNGQSIRLHDLRVDHHAHRLERQQSSCDVGLRDAGLRDAGSLPVSPVPPVPMPPVAAPTESIQPESASSESLPSKPAPPRSMPHAQSESPSANDMLMSLAGVRHRDVDAGIDIDGDVGIDAHDGDGEGADSTRRRRTRPRLAFTPMHALAAILLLAAALCASLTMLIQQAVRYNAALERSSVSAPASRSGGASADNQTEPPESSAPVTSDSASAQSAQCGHAESGQCDPGAGGSGNVGGNGNGDNDVGTDTGAGADSDTADGDAVAAAPALIDLNTATSEQLQTVKGIGPVTAGRIIDHRTAIGRFSSVDQLLDVEGIGAKTLAKIRGSLTVR